MARGIKSNQLGSQVNNKKGVMRPPSPKPRRTKQMRERSNSKHIGASLGLRLLTIDALSPSDKQKLEQDVIDYLHPLIKGKGRDIAEDFIAKHKYHLTPELKDLISLEISLMDNNK